MTRRFEDEFQPLRGDIVYGTSSARATYLFDVSQEVAYAAARKKSWCLINDYNEFFSTAQMARNYDYEHAGEYADRYVRAVVSDNLNLVRVRAASTNEEWAKLLTKRAIAFGDRLLDSRFGLGAFRHPWREDFTPPPEARADYRQISAFRRTSKMGIAIVASDPVFTSLGAKIHFVLDGMDMERVIKKVCTQDENGNPLWVPITISELRYVYRNWEALSETVLFYLDRVVVEAPWVTPGNKWDVYRDARLAKYKGVLPRKTLLG